MITINEQHIITAFGNKSQSCIRYLLFADQADKENLPNLARLFRAIAFSECIQARNYYLKLSHLEEQFVTSTVVIAVFSDIRNSILSACQQKNISPLLFKLKKSLKLKHFAITISNLIVN
jgi:rubrerythrin